MASCGSARWPARAWLTQPSIREQRSSRIRMSLLASSGRPSRRPGFDSPRELFAPERNRDSMPMIDVYAAAGTFGAAHALARNLAQQPNTNEGMPDIPMFRKNTAAFVHELPSSQLSNVDGDSTYVRVQVLTNAGALDRDKQLAVVSRFTTLVAEAAGDSSLADRTWVLLTEAQDGGWGLGGHANTNAELVAAARTQIAELQSQKQAELQSQKH